MQRPRETDQIAREDIVHAEAGGDVAEELGVAAPELRLLSVGEGADEGKVPGVLAEEDLGCVMLDGFVDAQQRNAGPVRRVRLVGTG